MAALKGDPVDRVPVSFFGHFYDKEQTAHDLSQCMINFLKRYDFDFMKIHGRVQAAAEIWGCQYQNSSDPCTAPTPVHSVLNTVNDWDRIEVKGLDSNPLPEMLEGIKQIREGLGPDVPIISTILSPFLVASTMTDQPFDNKKLINLIREAPEKAEKGIVAITETLCSFVPNCLEAGADGIFFAVASFPSSDWVTEEEYLRLVKPYELKVLERCQEASFNMIHVGGGNVRLDLIEDYPGDCIHWLVNAPGNPSIAEGLKLTTKAVVGGTNEQKAFLLSSPEELRAQTRKALQESGGQRHLIAILLSQYASAIKPEQFQAVMKEVSVPTKD